MLTRNTKSMDFFISHNLINMPQMQAGQRKTGPKKGQAKPGYRWVKGGRLVKAKK